MAIPKTEPVLSTGELVAAADGIVTQDVVTVPDASGLGMQQQYIVTVPAASGQDVVNVPAMMQQQVVSTPNLV